MTIDPYWSLPVDAFGVDLDQTMARRLEQNAHRWPNPDGSYDWTCTDPRASGIPIHHETLITPLVRSEWRPDGWNGSHDLDVFPWDKQKWKASGGQDAGAYVDRLDGTRIGVWGYAEKINQLELFGRKIGGRTAPTGRRWVGGAWYITGPDGRPVQVDTYNGTCPDNRGAGLAMGREQVTANELSAGAGGVRHPLAAYINNAMSGPNRYAVSPAGKCDNLDGRPPFEIAVPGGQHFSRPATASEILTWAARLPERDRRPFLAVATALATYGARVFAYGPKASFSFACTVNPDLLKGWIRPGQLVAHRPTVSIMPDGSKVTRFVGQCHAAECVPQEAA